MSLLKLCNDFSLAFSFEDLFRVGRIMDSETLFLECNLKLEAQQNLTLNVTPCIIVKQPSTVVSHQCYQQAVLFTVNVTKSPYKAVSFFVCFILRCTIYLYLCFETLHLSYV